MNSNELYHFGIKGMRWGVRRYQNPDGTLTAAGKRRYAEEPGKTIIINKDGSRKIPKGFTFNRIGKGSRDINKSGAIYVSYGKEDATRYLKSLGPTPIGKLLGTAGDTVQHISVKRSLRMPNDTQTAVETAKLLSKNKNLLRNLNDSIYSFVVTGELGKDITEKDISMALRNPSGKEGQKLAYGLSSLLADPNHVNDAKEVYQYFREQGYDAIPDIHDKLSGTSKTATIIINPDKVETKSTTIITKDIMKRGKDYCKTLEKLKVSDLIQ